MKCPNCGCNIPNTHKAMSSKGGKASKRKITPEQQEAMQLARKKNKAKRESKDSITSEQSI
jgi:hypothetical protein